MDFHNIARKLDLADSESLIRKAGELRRLSDLHFNSSLIGIGEVCKAVICLEIAATRLGVLFDRSSAIKLAGMSEKAYTRSFNLLQNGLGFKSRLDIRELAVQFGCVRLVASVQKGLSLYKDRFVASLPASRRVSADFSRPVFTAVAFYLCAKKNKLKVDKVKLIELSGTSESEFSCVRILLLFVNLCIEIETIINQLLSFQVATSMKDLCFDVFGISSVKKDPRDAKGNRDLLDALPEKRKREDGGYLSDDCEEFPRSKRCKPTAEQTYNQWKSSVIASNNLTKTKVLGKRTRQTSIHFFKEIKETDVK
ncbi:origin of replication complex subunit 6 [Cucumis melo var. makuwa]|uniref:Origin of replication complex subunit 6 n=1 Tax=Cucumis melo var. makuwa TaxID=1194695 RepID=A0A5A7SMQ3_CUCMM|nr:origin of replication complex subunit 6 [Cucumis melo var. makuwa]